MKKISLYIRSFFILMLLAWQLPWLYSFLCVKPADQPFCLYSSIVNDFITFDYQENSGPTRTDRSGHSYTQEETDSLLPFFYVRQLLADERFPDSINGVAVTPREAQLHNFTFRSDPSKINAKHPPLYPLLESLSGRVNLQMPDDVFRFTDQSVEFITMNTNQTDLSKSRLYTEVLRRKNFCFPAYLIAGNPTTRKDYDEGYLLTDREGKLYHLKQMKGRPYLREIEIPANIQITQLYITEFADRQTLGLFTDDQHRLYVIKHKNYEVIRTEIPAFNPKTDFMTIFGNMQDWTVCITNEQGYRYYAIDANQYTLTDSMQLESHTKSPNILRFTSSYDLYIYPRLF